MYAATSQCEPSATNAPAQRATGSGRISFKSAPSGSDTCITKLDRLYQQGCAKIRLPKVYGSNAAEAVLINSSGGLTGGDVMNWDIACASHSHAVVTTQACEKLYKSEQGTARVNSTISVADHARMDWLPQETILFNKSGLERNLDVDLSGSARFMAVESVLLGRIAMGEQIHTVSFSDNWRIRRDGRLVHADTIRLEGDACEIGANAATLAGHLAFSTLCYCGPEDDDYFDLLADTVRREFRNHKECSAGVSAFGGKLLIRLTAPDGLHLRKALIPLISLLRTGEPLPRVWTT